jgi:hypothetical protein
MNVEDAEHELIGVAFLCIDRLEFLLDHDDTISVVSFSGFPVGNIKLSVKAYVDEVQALPTTIVTHVEANIQHFMDHNLIVNFYFEYISGLPNNHCTDTYVSFKFLSHMPTYTTTQYLGYTPDPPLDSTVQVTRPITAALVDYIRTGCMEFKVFAVRSKPEEILMREMESAESTPMKNASPSRQASWRNTGSPAVSGTTSRNASFRGDKSSLERKLTQTNNVVEALRIEKRLLEEQVRTVVADYENVQQENEALRSELQSARAEIDNMYNISRGDGATIISNHESTMMPSASHGASARSPGYFFRSANSMREGDEKRSSVCNIM